MIVNRYYRREGEPTRIDIKLNLDHAKIMKILENPIYKDLKQYDGDVDEAKSSLPLYFFGELKDNTTIYLKDNYGIRSALILDYDKNMSIGDWHEAHKGKFEYYMYTSFKHSDEQHRFRVIIPTLQQFYMTAELKECLFEDFPNVDSTTFDNRGFYGPGYYTDNYGFLYSEGPVFNIAREYAERMQKIINRYPSLEDVKQSRAICTEDDRAFHAKCILDKARAKMDSVSWTTKGGRFVTLRSTWYYLWQRRDVVEQYEAQEMFDEYNLQPKQLKDLKGYMRSW